MRFFSRAGQTLLGAAMVGIAGPACFSAGGGTAPPPDTFYFPVALAVASDNTGDAGVLNAGQASVLYAANSDFDLQYNGGTVQSYNLIQLRKDAKALIDANLGVASPDELVQAGRLAFVNGSHWMPNCVTSPPAPGMPLGENCSPPVKSTGYREATVVIGAFASGMQLSNAPFFADPDLSFPRRRLFVTVRGDVTLTWADIDPTYFDPTKPDDATKYAINCGQGSDLRCNSVHRAGDDPNQPGNTRNVTMPGEPFGMAQTEDGTAVVVTHQSDTKTSLLKTGLQPLSLFAPDLMPNPPSATDIQDPTMQFVLDGLPSGGVGIAAIPHDPDAVRRCEDPQVNNASPCVRPAFLQTSRSTPEIDLVRYYNDDGSSLNRPFLQREAAYPITSNAVGTDSRGIVIDPTPRLACKAQPGADPRACATANPARVFFASRTPPALGIGAVGGTPSVGPGGPAMYDPDLFTLTGNEPLPNGPSNVYLAPIVDASGNYALRVFIVCFDSNQVVVYDPDLGAVENIIDVGPGPFAMAFDPFLITDVAAHAQVPIETPSTDPAVPPLRAYRFAYVASFTQSYVQMIDLDNAQPTARTFERVVFTLGKPTLPKGQ
jgi:hypothetical protein